MWRDYSWSYIKNNRSSSISVMIAAFISALLLSLLITLFYNMCKYEVEQTELEEGGWHSRLTGELDAEDIEYIRNFAHVEDVLIHEKESQDQEIVIDLYFDNMRAVLSDTPRIAEAVGISSEKTEYHYALLAMYLVRASGDTAPRLLFPMFLFITVMASFSLIVIIHNSFAVSMNARIHQLGILSGIGATPGQIRTCLLQEAAALCAVPVLSGNLFGIGISRGLLYMTNVMLGSGVEGRHESVFGCHPMVLICIFLITVITIWISAWLPAGKLSRLTPLEAIKNTDELQPGRQRNSFVLSFFFGTEGELAGNALKAQRKALRTASLSLVAALLAFTVMQCFFALSEISTRETYFERYQDAWDLMVTLKDTEVDSFDLTSEIQSLPGVENAVVYQKAIAGRVITEEEMSEELKALGGFTYASGSSVKETDGGWLIHAPVIILDDNSFLAYCDQIGARPQLFGTVILNQIRDVANPDFRHPRYMPYVKEDYTVSTLRAAEGEGAQTEIPVLAYTDEVPVLREEYATIDYYEMVHFIPVSLWREMKEQTGGAEEDSYIRVLGAGEMTRERIHTLQSKIEQLVNPRYVSEYENRILEHELNDRMIQGMKIIFGSFCVLLAVIGIGSVFSNTLGFVRQRKREYARYMSVGMTPEEIRKMFCIEALVIAGRPVLISLPPAVLMIGYMLKASYLEAGEFLAEAPFLPIGSFILVIFGFVALAYYLGWRNVRSISLAEVLRDDTMI